MSELHVPNGNKRFWSLTDLCDYAEFVGNMKDSAMRNARLSAQGGPKKETETVTFDETE